MRVYKWRALRSRPIRRRQEEGERVAGEVNVTGLRTVNTISVLLCHKFKVHLVVGRDRIGRSLKLRWLVWREGSVWTIPRGLSLLY
jgi:hypothetical protein